MRHLQEKHAAGFSMCLPIEKFHDARWIQVSWHNYSGPLYGVVKSRTEQRSAAHRVGRTACGRLAPLDQLCRELERRNGRQQLAPLPDFCSPDCPDCAVILDRIEESKVVQFGRYTSDAWTPLPRPRDFSADRIARKLAIARRRT